MAYCTNTDLALEYKAIVFSGSSSISSTQVDEFGVQASALIDSYIGTKYDLPIVDTSALSLLKMIAIWLVKSRINSILSVKTPQDKTKQDPDGPALYEQAIKMLEALRSGKLTLVGADSASSDQGLTSYLKDLDVDYQFQMESESW